MSYPISDRQAVTDEAIEMIPSKTEYDLGFTRYQQKLVLVKEGQHWTLIQHASSQRDETQRIHLSDCALTLIADHFRSAK